MNHSQADSELSESFDVDESDSSTSSSGSSETSSSYDGDESQLDVPELAKITEEVLQLPRGLCENAHIFREFFSIETWCLLPDEVQRQLQAYLPRFSHLLDPNEAASEQQRTISMLFDGELVRFGHTPLEDLQRRMEEGHCRPDVLQLRQSIAKSHRREQRFQRCEKLSQLAKDLFISRERLLRSAKRSSPDAELRSTAVLRRQQTSLLYTDTKLCAVRARKRFYVEIDEIAQQMGFRLGDFSTDEEDEDGQASESGQRETRTLSHIIDDVSALKSAATSADKCIYSTLFKRHRDLSDEDAMRADQRIRQRRLSNRNFREYLLEHKRRKLTEPTLPDFETSDIRLRDVCARAQMGGNFKRIFASGKTPGRKPKSKVSEPPALVPIQGYRNLEANTFVDTKTGNFNVAGDSVNFTGDAFNAKHLPQQQQPKGMTDQRMTFGEEAFSHDDADAFNIMDGDVDLQQEEVETYGTCEETIPAFVIANEVVLPAAVEPSAELPQKLLQTPHKHDSLGSAGATSPSLLSSQVVDSQGRKVEGMPKLEPITMSAKAGKDKMKTMSPLKVVPQQSTASAPVMATLTPLRRPQQSPPSVGKPAPALVTSVPSYIGSSELIQETHACFFSLIRDFFCATPNHRMRYDDLKEKIDIWLRNPITALNDWYAQAENWSALLTSAINFLAGDFLDQPDEYVPYIEYKTHMNIYQWIGAGRDSDTRLSALCLYWMQRRNETERLQPYDAQSSKAELLTARRRSTEIEDASTYDSGASPPPPPRCPTTWTVRAATSDEVMEFQRQERERFEQPHRSYTYRMHGYESVVGPVKGIYSQILALTKARGHSMMIGDRPNFVTILTLVRDATARLPNGEGTRADISELLKCSQYINRDAAENVLQTIVSGALDRMHTEHDPCVRYDPKRKIWIYLHRNRSEEEFERMHQQQQGLGKNKKPPNRKQKVKTPMTKCGAEVEAMSAALPDSAPVTTNTFSLPALVPANPIIVNSQNANFSAQKQSSQQLIKQQQPLTKSLPVPPLKYNIPPQQKSLLKTPLQTQRQPQEVKPVESSGNSSGQLLVNQRSQIRTVATTAAANIGTSGVAAERQFSFSMPLSKGATSCAVSTATANTTPIVVATPSGLQTVHVSNTAGSSANTTVQLQSATLGGKKVALSKPIIINQITATQSAAGNKSRAVQMTNAKQQQQQSQQHVQVGQQVQQQSHSFIIPISMATTSNETSKQQHPQQQLITFMDSAQLVATEVNPPKSQLPQQSQPKNIIRLVSAVNNNNSNSISGTATSKPIMSAATSTATVLQGGNIKQPVQIIGQRVIANTTVRPQQKSISLVTSGAGGSGTNAATGAGVANITQTNTGAIVKMSPQAFAALQQKHGQHILLKQTSAPQQQGQQQQRLVVGNTAIIAQSGQTLPKNVVLTQMTGNVSATAQKSVAINQNNSAVGQAASVGSQTSVHASNISSTTQAGTGRIQTINATNLTPQQQRVLLQNLKQQQQQTLFKTVQVVANTAQQQQQQQQQHTQAEQTMQVQHHVERNQAITIVPQRTVGATQAAQRYQQQQAGKTVSVVVPQPQGLTRILKHTTPNTQQQTATLSDLPGTRVLSSSTGQIISLESLLQKHKQGTLKISGGKATQAGAGGATNIIQLTSSTASGSSGNHYAVVSQARSIVSLGTPQRVVSAQSGSAALLGTPMSTVARDVTTVGSTLKAPISSAVAAGRILQTPSGVQPAGNQTKIISKATTGMTATGNLRVLNTGGNTNAQTHFNIANIQGKQVVFATKTQSNVKNVATMSASQAQQLQNAGIIIGGQSMKIQGNTNVQQIVKSSGGANVPTSQMQTVIMGNQILRVQQLPQTVKTVQQHQQQQHRVAVSTSNTSMANTNEAILNSNISGNLPKTLVLNSAGQPIRLQSTPASTSQAVSNAKNAVLMGATHQQQQGAGVKTSPASRVVLAVQGGGQIFLSPSFQGGSLNLKSLQNMKVVSLAQAATTKEAQDQDKAATTATEKLAQQAILKGSTGNSGVG